MELELVHSIEDEGHTPETLRVYRNLTTQERMRTSRENVRDVLRAFYDTPIVSSPPTLEQFRSEVVSCVKEKLQGEPWFKGVCLDDIDGYYPNNLPDAIEHAYFETLYWDGPSMGSSNG